MRFIYTDGNNKDFIELCHLLDDFLNELVVGEHNRAQYIPDNKLDNIHDVIVIVASALNILMAYFYYTVN